MEPIIEGALVEVERVELLLQDAGANVVLSRLVVQNDEGPMLTEADARQKIMSLLAEWGRYSDGDLVLVEERTLTKPYGWVFFYNSRRYLETRDVFHALAGNGPVVILASTGEVVPLGTARRPEEEIMAFERQRKLPSGS